MHSASVVVGLSEAPAAANVPSSKTGHKLLPDKFCNLSFLFYSFHCCHKRRTKNVKKKTMNIFLLFSWQFSVLASCSNATFDLAQAWTKKGIPPGRTMWETCKQTWEEQKRKTTTKMPLIILGSLKKCRKIVRNTQNFPLRKTLQS